VIVFDQLLIHLLAMAGRSLKDARDGVLINIKDPSAGAHAVALGKGFQNAVNRLLIGVESSENALVAGAELTATSPTAIKRRPMWPIVTDQF
jgi:hypothetical protein